MPVRISVEEGPHRGISRTDLTRRARAMLATLQLQDSELSILLTGDDQIRNLNRLYRSKDRPTDVLAFAQREGELGELAGRVLGDVIVSVPTARRQAQERGVGLIEEVTMLLAHGLLHLLGWDHETARKDRLMRRETERLCAAAEQAHRARPTVAKQVKGGTATHANDDSPRRRRRPATR